MMERVNLLDLPLSALEGFFQQLGEAPFRARQVFGWLYQRRERSIDRMTDLSRSLREQLAQVARVDYPEVVGVETSSDGTQKFLFRLEDDATIEAVVIPEAERWTLCISSQAGCALGCTFCHTARLGPGRNLSVAEYMGQLLGVLAARGESSTFSNIVFMGMGEPLANLEHLLHAIAILTDDRAFGYSARRITVSTAGLCPQILELGRRVPVRLAVSLNATTDEIRNQLMPINRRYRLATLFATLKAFPLPPRNQITLEYALIRDINDSQEDARRLIQWTRLIPCKVNLLTYNEHPACAFRAPLPERVQQFKEWLIAGRVRVLERRSRGSDIRAACGQLAGGRK